MKLFYGTVLSLAAAQRFERKFSNFQTCLDGLGDITDNVENGRVECAGSICSLKCDDHYNVYGGAPSVKCITNHAGLKWNRPMGTCKTCDELIVDEDLMTKTCMTLNNGLQKCVTRCKNKQGIKPINKRVVPAVCRCVWRKDGLDKCHWRMGKRILDISDFSDTFSEDWNCGIPATTAPVVTTEKVPVDYRIPQNLVCESQNVDRIVGGVEALPHSWPWMVYMRFGGFICGGTIVDDETIMTAAHCCSGFTNRENQVFGYVGEHDLRFAKIEQGQFKVNAKKIIIHPEFERSTLNNDICIVKTFHMNLSNRNTAAAACLPGSGTHPAENTKCWAAGWGKMGNNRIADVLQEVDLKIISDDVCDNTQNAGDLIRGSMFCAGYLEGGKDGCQGDSGGPLICAVDGQPILTGITSWGYGCAEANSPGVWTKVESYTGWIKSLMINRDD